MRRGRQEDLQMTRYIGLIDGKPGAYSIVFPDLPGCTSMGKTIEDVIFNGADAMRLWVEATEQDGDVVPSPRSFEAMRDDPDVILSMEEGATIATVPLVRSTGRPSKANLSIDTGVLAAIDSEAERRNLTRSAFIEAMVRKMLPRMA
jgi:predicted RNase H-like HicB family nuclease